MILYNLGLLLGLFASLPGIIWKRKLGTFWRRLRSTPPSNGGKSTIWIHAVSVGEAKSAKGLLEKIKAEYPHLFVLFTTATASGLEEAKRSCKKADAICFMPFDFSWVMRRWARALRPKILVLIEGDIWLQHMQSIKQFGGQVILVSGKISKRSAYLFSWALWALKKLFSSFDHVLVQNEEYQRRLTGLLGDKFPLQIGGNLKLNATPEKQTKVRTNSQFSIAIISTHAPEEKELLETLQPVQGTLYLAPRHPERFAQVETLLQEKGISYALWSRENFNGARVILVDAMGQIPNLCALCDMAIVAGSFSSRVGGHNILEPCLYGLPVFFGPHMDNQRELVERVLQAGAGKQVSTEDLSIEIARFQQEPAPMKQGAQNLSKQAAVALDKTWQVLVPLLKK